MAGGFRCKQFFVAHDLCAMKVTTDSLILGSWASVFQARHILDIGCGSGILSLMMAQRSGPQTQILAMDIDERAVEQTRINSANSPWAKQIETRHCAISELTISRPIDTIICNPPYFQNTNVGQAAHLKQSENRQKARHQTSLSIHDVFFHATRLTCPQAQLSCLYPTSQRPAVVAIAAEHGWSLYQELAVINHKGTQSHVTAFTFLNTACYAEQQTLIIRDADNRYSEKFRALCRDFYLAF